MADLPTSAGPEAFVEALTARARPLSVEHARAYWRFSRTGDAAAQAVIRRSEQALSDLHASTASYAAIVSWLDSGIDDPLLRRQLELLKPEFRRAQVDRDIRERIIALALEIEEVVTIHRARFDGRTVSSNELDRLLLVESDDRVRREVWSATRQVGQLVRGRVLELVHLRNRQARTLGFDDFYSLALDDQEMRPRDLFDLLDQLQLLTEAPWAARKARMDGGIAALRGKDPSALAPWDYPDRFLQSAPRQAPTRSTDAWFNLRSIKRNTLDLYSGIGLPLGDLWSRADLLPRDGKCPHAFCIGIDNPRDVRVLCNLDATARWMETALHEFGHAIYNAGIDPDLPWLLRDPAHTFVTEAVAMFFGRRVRDPEFLLDLAGVPAELAGAAADDLAEQQLTFARWGLLVTRFERSMYADPDQDLDARWWELAERIQGLRRPDGWEGGDWASKVHVACYPAYYQNYLLGELLASQFEMTLRSRLGPGLLGRPEVGAFFSRLFTLGQRLGWEETVLLHTGSALSAEHWAAQFASPKAKG